MTNTEHRFAAGDTVPDWVIRLEPAERQSLLKFARDAIVIEHEDPRRVTVSPADDSEEGALLDVPANLGASAFGAPTHLDRGNGALTTGGYFVSPTGVTANLGT